ncbi:hypothetical protein [Oharaeibacter diazotrophicus]|uniref:DUF2946 family protein n=1 Tax=Oharaeibacter diazotrophicus TaxID=1920512 RepID=A0A4R6RKV6_9HYPH|nr:hypothetical protein [Oharaeibacter diazotrophicus]TDP87243.1 hypothetical protein EDD54_1132 [Oharaeibacter diazotrophicus]BBE70814.1 hypothetical protein OHA_1_00381 [Pleomorphomonas sp. SM30]GLS77563.1 hypothetical protein GCM10007904_29000 [Oharaeibacter diazotrophicus]
MSRRAGAPRIPVRRGATPLLGRIRAARDLAAAAAILYALVAVLVGFAHRPLVLQPPEAVVAALPLPDGTVPPICGKDGADPAADHHAGAALCDACLVTAAPGLPVAVPAVLAIDTAAVDLPPRRRRATAASLATGPPPARGPPSPSVAI